MSTSDSSKACTACGETKPLSAFGTAGSSRYPDQLRGDCRDCVKRRVSSRPNKSVPDESLLPASCANAVCTVENPSFTWRNDTGRYIPKCKRCVRDEANANAARKAAERAARGSVACVDCGIVKPPEMFDSDRNYCKECHFERRKNALQTKDATSALPPGSKCGKCDSNLTHDNAIWRTDTKSWRADRCRKCPPNPVYSQRSRERMAEEDYFGYRQRANESHRAWVAGNGDRVATYQRNRRTNAAARVKSIMNDAASRGISFSFVEEFNQMVLDPCFYCGAPSSDLTLHGFDRVDNTAGYSTDNVVTACACCNRVKGTKQVDEFLTDVRRIAAHMRLDDSHISDEAERSIRYGRHLAEPKNKAMKLSSDLQLLLKCSPCDYCGISFSCGIDRIDSNGLYIVDNVVPCCTTCNFMKCHITLEQFKSHISRIVLHTGYWVLRDTEDVMTTLTGQARPVAFDCNMGTIVFPSFNIAEGMGVASNANLRNATRKERRRSDVSRTTACKILKIAVFTW